MSVKFFLDTNIFIYSFDLGHVLKQKTAKGLIERALKGRDGMISWQVAQEFLNVALRKFETFISPAEVRVYFDVVLTPLRWIDPSPRLYHRALELKAESGFAFYDSLILASAEEGGCKTLYTEDLGHRQKIAGLTIQNPFL